MRGAFAVDRPEGERWDLAIELLDQGGTLVSFESLLLYRDAAGPAATGTVHVEICTAWQPRNLTTALADTEVRAGLAHLDVLLADERLADLVARHGLSCEYVDDYETGRAMLGIVGRDGVVEWRGAERPT